MGTKAFETFSTVDIESGVETWRAYFTDNCFHNHVGDFVPNTNAMVGRGDTELEAIASLCMLKECCDNQTLVIVTSLPKFCVGQRVYVTRKFIDYYYYATVYKIQRSAYVIDNGNGMGLHLSTTHSYKYHVREYDGTTHEHVPEECLESVVEDGA